MTEDELTSILAAHARRTREKCAALVEGLPVASLVRPQPNNWRDLESWYDDQKVTASALKAAAKAIREWQP